MILLQQEIGSVNVYLYLYSVGVGWNLSYSFGLLAGAVRS